MQLPVLQPSAWSQDHNLQWWTQQGNKLSRDGNNQENENLKGTERHDIVRVFERQDIPTRN